MGVGHSHASIRMSRDLPKSCAASNRSVKEDKAMFVRFLNFMRSQKLSNLKKINSFLAGPLFMEAAIKIRFRCGYRRQPI